MSSLLVQDDGLIHVRSQDSYQNESPQASKAAGPSGWFAGTAAHPGPSEETFELGLALDAGIPAPLLVMLVLAGLGALWMLKRTLDN